MKRFALSALTVLLASLTLSAQDSVQFPRHEVRIGWGDMAFEHGAFYNTYSKSNYRYAGHFFGEYQYAVANWFGVGFEADYEQVTWDVNASQGQTLPTPEKDHFFYNLTLMPTLRFTYFRKGAVTMYSGLGFGLTVNGGSDLDYKGRKVTSSPALGITAYGISVGWGKVFIAAELGGLNAMVSKDEIYMAASRLLSLSIGLRL